MIVSRVTPAIEEERVEVEGAEEEGGTAKATGSSVSTHGHFGQNWASLRRTEPTLMAPMCWKIWFCISYKTHSRSNKHGSISFMIDNMHYVIFRI